MIEAMNLGNVLKKEILGATAGFGRQFVNLLSAPRAYAKAAHVFDAARFDAGWDGWDVGWDG